MADRSLQVFHAVAKQRSFTRAAQVLYMSQPAVTYQVLQLEERFNTRLFDRGRASVSLTPAGEVALQYAQEIIDLSSEMTTRVRELQNEIAGTLHIGASMTIAEFMLPAILGEFKTAHPAVRSRLFLANSRSIDAQVAEHALDIGFVESPARQSDLETVFCCDDELVVVCSPQFPLAKCRYVVPQQLLEHPYVSREPGSGTRDAVSEYLRAAGIDPNAMNTVMELGSPIALNAVLETGLGFSIASQASVPEARRLGALIAVPLRPRLVRPISMLYPSSRFRSRLVTAFVEFAAQRLLQTGQAFNDSPLRE